MVAPPEIDLESLKKNARHLLEFLDRNEIQEPRDLESVLNQSLIINRKTKEHVTTEIRPSNLGTATYDISYIQYGKGILLDVKINPSFEYTAFIVKGKFELPGYESFAKDNNGNIAQMKRIGSTSIEDIRNELISFTS
tara:strand:- start:576 stop:989 length:414 start_codon:yes stop_codon:yes gene_type:complete